MKRLLLVVLATAAFALGQKIAGGPVVVNVTPKTATVVWVVETDQAVVQPSGDAAAAKTSPSLRVEKTLLTGLQPGKQYEYSVSSGAAKGSFKTPPMAAAPFRFVVYGDTRTRHDVHRRVMEAVGKHGIPDFVLHTGDLVENGNDSALWSLFFDIEKELLRQTVFFPSLGNHERNSREYYDFFQVGTPYYSFDWGNGHFIVLNSDLGNAASSARAK